MSTITLVGSSNLSSKADEVAAPARASTMRFATWLTYAPIVVTTVLSKISIPPYGARGLGVSYPILIVLFLAGALSGRVGISPRRGAYLGVLIGLIGLVHVLRQEDFSVTSLLFLIVVSTMLVLEIRRPGKRPADVMNFVANFVAVIAVLGVIQFSAQFVVGERYAFPIESFTPKGFLISGFHYLNTLYYGSSILKTNGIFLSEPSFYSQLVAIGLLAELSCSQRLPRIALLCLAILFSYSGTGFIVLAAGLPIVLISTRRFDLLAALVGMIVLAAAFAVPLKLDILLNRISEFGQHSSSAYQRFIGWYFLAQDSLSQDTMRALFGYGAGTFRNIAFQYSSYGTAELLHSKIIEEYGLLGFIGYIGFLMYCIFSSPFPLGLRVAVAVLQFMNGAFAEPATGITLSLLLLTPFDVEQGDVQDRK